MSEPAAPGFLDPVDEILSTWRAFAQAVQTGTLWGDQRNAVRNVIIDAEALLTFLLPEMEIDRLGFRSDDGTVLKAADDSAGAAIAGVTGEKYNQSLSTPARTRLLAEVLTKFYEDHGGDDPQFAGGSYLELDDSDPQAESLRANLEVVDAYTFSLTLSLATLDLIRRWFPKTQQLEDDYAPIERLRSYAEVRLTRSLEGLVDSFTLSDTLTPGEWTEKTKLDWPESRVEELKSIREQITLLRPKLSQKKAYEIGWSWGPIEPSKRLHKSDRTYGHYAVAAPYLYFTVVALDGIRDLYSERVLTSGILSETQQGLAQTLRMYADMTERYWSALAIHQVGGRWALESVPWSTSDGDQSDYWTLYLLRVALARLAATQHDTQRILGLMEELAQRARIIRAPVPAATDPAIAAIHSPGRTLWLEFASTEAAASPTGNRATNPKVEWLVYDFSPQLLKVAGQLLSRVTTARDRAELTGLAGRIWEHLLQRRQGTRAWDTLQAVYPQWYEANRERLERNLNERALIGSWYLTERVIEALVAVAAGERVRPLVAEAMEDFLFELIAELEYSVTNDAAAPIADHANRRKRRSAHEARRALLDKNPARALEIVIEVLAPKED